MATSTKEQYQKYSLIALLIGLGVLLFRESWPFINGFLGAFTIYLLVRKQMIYLHEQKKIKKSMSAFLIILEVIVLVLIPLSLVVWMVVGRVQHISIDLNSLFATVQHFIDLIKEHTGFDFLSSDNIATYTGYATGLVQTIIGQVSSFAINAVVMLFLLYFMLTGMREMETFVYDLLPFTQRNKQSVVLEIKQIVVSNAIGIPLLAVIQGFVGLIGYVIFGAPTPMIFGVLTAFATIIPLVGTGIVWFPLTVYLALSGNWFGAIGLLLYSLLILTNVDNVIRFMLQKKMANIHPLITVFGVIIGLSIFGFFGIIFGPLLLAMFFLFLRMFKDEYLKKRKTILHTQS